ncbi:MAG: prepilin-type N-terminal cleavage/methylation domain-containing protein [Pseudomonadota bacterium]
MTDPMHPAPAQDEGFSLLETLVALAIMAVSAVILFQSLTTQLAVAVRIERSTTEALGEAVDRAGFRAVVEGLTPAWEEMEDQIFQGDETGFTGLTTGVLDAEAPSLALVRLSLTEEGGLVYQSAAGGFPLARFSEPAAFSYLGADGTWRSTWPPPETPHPPPTDFEDGQHFDTPQLPKAIRIQTATRAEIDWIALPDWRSDLPMRRQDVLMQEVERF